MPPDMTPSAGSLSINDSDAPYPPACQHHHHHQHDDDDYDYDDDVALIMTFHIPPELFYYFSVVC